MGIILGALGGAGEALQRIGDAGLKNELEKDRDAQRADLDTQRAIKVAGVTSGLELERQKTLEQFRASLKDAPLQRITSRAQALAGEDVPVEPAPVTRLGGIAGKPENLNVGMQGDLAALRKEAMALPDGHPDKEPLLAQIDQQASAELDNNRGIVAGQMRKRTPDEAMRAAADEAKANDMPAYAAYEKEVGAPLRAERREDTREKRADNQEARDLERLRIESKRLDTQEQYQRRREERLDKLAELQEIRADNQATAAERSSQRAAAVSLMQSTEKELERVMALSKDATMDEATKSIYVARTGTLQRDLERTRKAVESFVGEGMPAATPAPTPARNGWDSTSGEVFKDGKVIGTAKNEGDARKLYQGGAAKPAEPKRAAAPAEPEYTPPADSPAGRAAAAREGARSAGEQRSVTELQVVQSAAQQAIANGSAQAAQNVQDMPGFGRLDAATKSKIFQLVNRQ